MKLHEKSQKITSRIYSLEKRIVIQFAPISLLNPMIKSLPSKFLCHFWWQKGLLEGVKIQIMVVCRKPPTKKRPRRFTWKFSEEIKIRKHQNQPHPQSVKVFCSEFETQELNRANGSRLRDYWLEKSFADLDVLDHISPKTYYHLCFEERVFLVGNFGPMTL